MQRHHPFLSQATFKLVIQENVIIGVLALAFLVPLATGTFDLAIGANMSMALVIITKLAQHKTVPEVPAMIIAIVACGIGGFISGFFPSIPSQILLPGIGSIFTDINRNVKLPNKVYILRSIAIVIEKCEVCLISPRQGTFTISYNLNNS